MILLSTLNAKYIHSSIGLRYLYANLNELQSKAKINEFTINDNVQSVAEDILEYKPKILGLGVYIWNAQESAELIEIIKKVSPETKIVLGGPEASHMPFRVDFTNADYIIQGEGEVSFYELCKNIYSSNFPDQKIIPASMPNLGDMNLPYKYYSDEDVKNRYIYVEASRGCPFECEFCLSSIDEKVRNFNLDKILEEFEVLWTRGVRSFKFIDRTFNLNMKFANAILDFFLSKEPPYFAHFEVIPDHFPDSIKNKIATFPPGSIQLEIGIQTLNNEIASNINRPLKIDKIKKNINFLEKETSAHMHLDLIVGLPGESLESFGDNLDELTSISSSEIQIGILKKLSGTTLDRHDKVFGMVYSNTPPYDILQNNNLSFKDIQIMKRFARFWDLYYNSGNFKKSIALLFQDKSVYAEFYKFSIWIYNESNSTWKISLDRLASYLFSYMCEIENFDKDIVAKTMLDDLLKVSGRKAPAFLRDYAVEHFGATHRDFQSKNARLSRHLD